MSADGDCRLFALTSADPARIVSASMERPAIRFRVYGFPVAQGRPRAFVPKGWTRPRVYDPAESKDWKRTVAAQAIEHKPAAPYSGAISMQLTFFLLRPKSISPTKRPHPTVKPDLDNLCKAVLDAVRGILFTDDALLVELHLQKVYGMQPGAEIEIAEVGP